MSCTTPGLAGPTTRNTNVNNQYSLINRYLSSHIEELTVAQVKHLFCGQSTDQSSRSTLDRVSFSVKIKKRHLNPRQDTVVRLLRRQFEIPQYGINKWIVLSIKLLTLKWVGTTF
jgi:hypothetical protein